MKVEMNDNGGIDITDLSVDQVSLLVHALKQSPNQAFMDDAELNKMLKLLAILQSEVFSDLSAGKINLSKFNQ